MPNGTTYRRWLKAQALKRERIKALYNGGMGLTAIAKRYRISPARVHQIVRAK